MLMQFDPFDGAQNPWPADPECYRRVFATLQWLFNPYTGEERSPEDVRRDPKGFLIVPGGRG